MLRTLSKLPRSRVAAALPRSARRNASTSVRAAQESEESALLQNRQQGAQRGGDRAPARYQPSLFTSPFSLTRELAPVLPTRISNIFRDLEQELESFTRGGLSTVERELAPVARTALGAVDVRETDKAYEFFVDVPGVPKDSIKVRVDRNGVLAISGKREVQAEEDNDKSGFRRVERGYGEFTRRFQLPDNVDPSAVQAKVENGVLHVIVPKKEEHQQDLVTDIPVE